MTTQTNKVAIVTGGSGGIGAAVADRLAQDGFTVVVNYTGNAAAAQAVVARIEAAGGRAVAAQADVSDVTAVARMFDSAETAFGGVDVLVNNAGIMNLATIKDSDDALFDRHIAVNLKGTFNTLREAARRLQRWRSDRQLLVQRHQPAAADLRRLRRYQGRGRGHDQHPRQGAARPKHHRQRDRPGPTATKLFLDGKPQEVIDQLSKMAPLERLGQPQDIANAVAFLAGPDGAWINGQTLRVNGGII